MSHLQYKSQDTEAISTMITMSIHFPPKCGTCVSICSSTSPTQPSSTAALCWVCGFASNIFALPVCHCPTKNPALFFFFYLYTFFFLSFFFFLIFYFSFSSSSSSSPSSSLTVSLIHFPSPWIESPSFPFVM